MMFNLDRTTSFKLVSETSTLCWYYSTQGSPIYDPQAKSGL